MTTDRKCPISGELMQPVFSETILEKYLVTYYYCEQSGILTTETPYWLDESYQSAIADTDTGILMRNIASTRFLERILYHLFKDSGKFLDVSGGYGVLTRLLRDADMHIIFEYNLSNSSQFLLFNKYARKAYALYVRWKRKGMNKNWDDYLLLKNQLRSKLIGERERDGSVTPVKLNHKL